ncbi:hypothetical protein EFT49_07650 [Leuconostoc falkenbergense]|uniref:hypothetical protein n=1 Tax=Leuconostoc falkenbergense TaxID=2766470 RepID=UPI0021AAE619|nr:hypothetical protein [Leuconostoc falkenbergense]MCT4420068.1 hypothetical protein [Leuconostoc falkenbergense]
MKIMDFEIIPHDSVLNPTDFNSYQTGIPSLDTFLFEELDKMEQSNRTSMSVAYIGKEIVGMFALSAAQITTRQTSDVFNSAFGNGNQEYNSLPLISLDHFSVNKKFQYDPGKEKNQQFSVGKNLLYAVFETIVVMRSIYNIAVAGMVVEAIESATDWYEKQHFEYLDNYQANMPKETSTMIIGYDMIEQAYYETNELNARN